MNTSGKRKRATLVREEGASSKALGRPEQKTRFFDKKKIVIPIAVLRTISGFLTGSSTCSSIPPSLLLVMEWMREVLRRSNLPELPASLLSHSAEFIRDRKMFNIFAASNKELRHLMLSNHSIPWPRLNVFETHSADNRHYAIQLSDDARWLCRFHYRQRTSDRQIAGPQNQDNGNNNHNINQQQGGQFLFQRWNVVTGREEAGSRCTIDCDSLFMTHNWSKVVVWTMDSPTFRIYTLSNNDNLSSDPLNFNPEQYFDVHSTIPHTGMTLKIDFHKSGQMVTAVHGVMDEDGQADRLVLANYDLNSRQLIKHTNELLFPRYVEALDLFASISTDEYTLWETNDNTLNLWKHDVDDNRIYDLGMDTSGFGCDVFVPNPTDPLKIAIIGTLSDLESPAIWNSLSMLHLHELTTIMPDIASDEHASWIVDPISIRDIALTEIQFTLERRPLFEWFPDGKYAYFTDPNVFHKIYLLQLQEGTGGFKHIHEDDITDPYYLYFVQRVSEILKREKDSGGSIHEIQLQSKGKIVMLTSSSGRCYIEQL